MPLASTIILLSFLHAYLAPATSDFTQGGDLDWSLFSPPSSDQIDVGSTSDLFMASTDLGDGVTGEQSDPGLTFDQTSDYGFSLDQTSDPNLSFDQTTDLGLPFDQTADLGLPPDQTDQGFSDSLSLDSNYLVSQGEACPLAAGDFQLLGKREDGKSCGSPTSSSAGKSSFDPNEFLNNLPAFDPNRPAPFYNIDKKVCDPALVGDRPFPVCHSGLLSDMSTQDGGLSGNLFLCTRCMYTHFFNARRTLT